MKVGFNARYLYDPGLRGFNRYSFCLLRALEEIPDVDICLLSEERYPVHEVYRSALRAEVINLAASRTFLWEQWVLPRFLKRLKPDVFHAPADGGLPLRKECPYVMTLHGVPGQSLGYSVSSGELTGSLSDYLDTSSKDASRVEGAIQSVRTRLLSRLYLQAADLVITVSEFSKRELVRFLGLKAENVRVIHEAADDHFTRPQSTEYIEQVRARHRIPNRFVLFVGGFDKRKNLSTLLQAFAQLRDSEPRLALVLVGIGGDLEGCRLQAAALGFREGETIFFLHRISDSELAALYRAASLFTTLSWHEGFCLPLVEAMTCGTPILASSFGAIPEILGEGGWLVDPRRLETIVEAMRTILSQSEIRDGLRARSLLRARSFSWRKAAEETVSAYKELYTRCA
jgi:glycosyltransferase involved in cell wall biosynthesis